MSAVITPFSLRDAHALIERLLPVQKLSVEAYKEQMAGSGKTLTALGSFWKGRKPLILNKTCILGCLLPATDDLARDLLEALRDRIAVERTQGDDVEDQQVEGALRQIGFGVRHALSFDI